MPTIFDPVQMGGQTFKNRIFMAPLTRNRAQDDGVHVDMAATYYKQRASAGLIISEATQISPIGKGYDNTPGIYTDEQVAAWRKITDAVHDGGSKIFAQLWHVGRISHVKLQPNQQKPHAPSAIKADAQTFAGGEMVDVSEPKAMTIEDIEHTIRDYKHAAQCAKEAGFDGIEVHAANGYLIDQFLCDNANHRDDQYGGSPEKRARFLFEVMDAVLSVWDSQSVGIRLSPTGTFNGVNDSDPLATFGHVVDRLNTLDLAYLHIVERFPGLGADNHDLNILEQLIDRWNGFYMANGDYDMMKAQDAVQSGHANAVAFGRPFISNPDLPYRMQHGIELNEGDHDTFYGGDERGYTDYPFADKNKQVA